MERNLENFLDKFRISKRTFKKSRLNWSKLLKIADDYDNYRLTLNNPTDKIITDLKTIF